MRPAFYLIVIGCLMWYYFKNGHDFEGGKILIPREAAASGLS